MEMTIKSLHIKNGIGRSEEFFSLYPGTTEQEAAGFECTPVYKDCLVHLSLEQVKIVIAKLQEVVDRFEKQSGESTDG